MDGRRGLKRSCSEEEARPAAREPEVACCRADAGEIRRCGVDAEARARPSSREPEVARC
jgi:hypothetical protein